MKILDWSKLIQSNRLEDDIDCSPMSTVATATAYFEEQSPSEHELRQRISKISPIVEEKKMLPVFHRRRNPLKSFYSIKYLLVILIFLTIVFILYSSLSLSPLLRFLDPYSYVLVLDAGSTGTRIHVYKFRSTIDNDNGETFVLKNEIFKERKPGLSSFADHISKAEDQINELLQIADHSVSRFKHRSTPLVLRATAGLRLISETKQKFLLEAVSNTFDKYGFYRPKLDIAIMNETEEGIDAWLTLVYLKGWIFFCLMKRKMIWLFRRTILWKSYCGIGFRRWINADYIQSCVVEYEFSSEIEFIIKSSTTG